MRGSRVNKSILLLLLVSLLSFTVVFYAADNNNGMSLANEIKEETYITESDPYTALEGIEETRGADVKKEYKLNKVLDVAYGKVYKYKQYYKGAEVYGRELIVSADHNGKVLSVSGEYYKVGGIDESIKTEAEIEEQLRAQGITVKVTDKIVYTDGGAKYAYNAVCADNGLKYIVSALNGEILFSCPDDNSNSLLSKQTDADGNIIDADIEYENGMYYLSDYTRNIFTLNANNSELNAKYYYNRSGVFEPIAVSAFNNAVKAYDFYTDPKNIGVSLRGVNGGNDNVWGNFMQRDKEIPIMIYVHYGIEYENANCGFDPYSNNVIMLVGDGKRDGVLYQPARAADIIAHEYQHAVTYFAAGFEYMNDSGALDEAFSDIFGMLIEGHDPSEDDFWTIGEKAVPNGGNLRSIKGGTVEQIYNVKQKFPNCNIKHDHIYCDYGGAHINSTIISHVQYLLSQARPEFFTRERIGTLWYTTLCSLGAFATFDDFTEQFYQSAINLGYEDDILNVIDQSLKDVGLINMYSVTFVDETGKELYKTQIISGGSVEYPEVPKKKETAKYYYEFTGWSDKAENVNSDMVIKAEYKRSLRNYPVKFYDMEGNLLASMEFNYGAKISPPSFIDQPYPADKFNFEGWYLDKEFTSLLDDDNCIVTGETSVYGKWTQVKEVDQNPDQNAPPSQTPDKGDSQVQPGGEKNENNKDADMMPIVYIAIGLSIFIILIISIAVFLKKKKT